MEKIKGSQAILEVPGCKHRTRAQANSAPTFAATACRCPSNKVSLQHELGLHRLESAIKPRRASDLLSSQCTVSPQPLQSNTTSRRVAQGQKSPASYLLTRSIGTGVQPREMRPVRDCRFMVTSGECHESDRLLSSPRMRLRMPYRPVFKRRTRAAPQRGGDRQTAHTTQPCQAVSKTTKPKTIRYQANTVKSCVET